MRIPVAIGTISIIIGWEYIVMIDWIQGLPFWLQQGIPAVALLGVALMWLPEMKQKIRSGKKHRVDAKPVRFSFSVPPATGTTRPPPWYKRIKNRLLRR